MVDKNISINGELYDKIAERARETDFKSVDEYVTYVLEQIIEDDTTETTEESFNAEEEAEVKKRLKSLGYME